MQISNIFMLIDIKFNVFVYQLFKNILVVEMGYMFT